MSESTTASRFTIRVKQPDGTVDELFKPTDKQHEVLEILTSGKYPNIFVVGNRGGGKSWVARWFAHAMALTYPGLKYAILRTSYPELQKTHINFLPSELDRLGGEKAGLRFNKTEHIAYYPKGSMGFYAQCATEDDVRKVLGSEFALVIFDEAPTFEYEHMALISASLRVPKGSPYTPLALYLGNPIGRSIESLWTRFIDKDVDPDEDPYYNPDDWFAFEMRLEDNPHLDYEDYRKRLSSGLLPQYRKAWLDGERTSDMALFDVRPSITVEEPQDDGTVASVRKPYHVISELPTYGDANESILKQPWVTIYRAYDHGFYPDPAICLWFAVFGKRIVCFHEQTWLRKVAKDIARDIRTTTELLLGPNRRVAMTYCDPSIDIRTGADVYTIKDIFETNGVPMECSTNDRVLYAHAINSALNDSVAPGIPRIQFLSGRTAEGAAGCPYTLKHLPRMQADPRNPLRMADHKHDHGPVALAYFLMSHIPTSTPAHARIRERIAMPQRDRWVLGSRR